MELWADVFGRANCTVRLYDAVSGRRRHRFRPKVLGIEPMTLRSEPVLPRTHDAGQSNETREARSARVQEDENTNALTVRRKGYRVQNLAALVDEDMDSRESEPDSYQEFSAPRERAATFWERFGQRLKTYRQRTTCLRSRSSIGRGRTRAGSPIPGSDPDRQARDRTTLRSDQPGHRLSVGAVRDELARSLLQGRFPEGPCSRLAGSRNRNGRWRIAWYGVSVTSRDCRFANRALVARPGASNYHRDHVLQR